MIPRSDRGTTRGRSLRRGRRPGVLLAACLAAAGLLAAAAAQERAEMADGLGASQAPFTEVVEVNVVNVEVYVTDGRGRPITGLGREDFEVFEDGRPMTLTNFYAVAPALDQIPVSGIEVGRQAAAEPPERREEPSLPAEERRLHLVVYVDNANLLPGERNRVIKDLDEILRQRLEHGDRVMVVTASPGLELATAMTDDPEAVATALHSLRKGAAGSNQWSLEKRLLIRQLELATQDEAEAMFAAVESFAQNLESSLERSISTLEAFVGSLTGLPGRKAVIHVSSGLSQRPGEEMFLAWARKFGGVDRYQANASTYDLTRRFRELTEHANASGVTFYTLNAAGGGPAREISAEAGIESLTLTGFEFEAIESSNRRASLARLAVDTGGVPILDANFPGEVFEQVAQSFDSYYSLGYSTPSREGRKPHRIEVKVRRPGLKVRHREAYRERSVGEKVTDRTHAALLFGERANPLRVLVEVGEPRPGGEKKAKNRTYSVPVLIKVPLGRVALVPGQGEHLGQVRVKIAIREEGGALTSPEMREVPIRIPDAQLATARGQYFAYQLDLTVGPGLHRLAVGVMDGVGTEASYVSQDVVVGGG